jgi:monofunctional biosynthetic peptidoglycan transglycosylase
LGKNICLASVTSEDPKFFNHYGFDFEQIIDSVKKSFDKGKKPRGASTISQQTAKNLFFTPNRSWIRKGLEVYITIAIELLWTKKRILEVYLNIIEMGKGVYGAEAAALFYFNKSANKLTAQEAAAIAACYPNPRRWTANKPSRYIKKKQQIIARYMYRIGPLPWEMKKNNK